MAGSKLPEGELAFNYFPGNYRWSHGLLIALGGAPWGGAEIGEVNRIVHADPVPRRSGKGPVMLFLDGFDVTKEIQYFRAVPDLAARGVSCLILDGPGNGEAIRFRIFTREEGGYHHCQVDNVSIGTAYMRDWVADVLQPER